MAEYTPTPLGGKSTETSLDVANQAMRAMPWYTDLLKSMGQTPNNVQLNDQQRKQVLTAARAHGFDVSNEGMQIDESGNIDKRGHKIRNTLIVAGIAAATIATMGAAGAFAGAAGAAGAAGGAGAGAAGAAGTAGGVLGSTAIGTGAIGGIAGGTGLAAGTTAAGLGTAGTLGTAAKMGALLSGGKGASGYLNTAGQVAGMLGDVSAGRAAGRVGEANAAAEQNRAALDRSRLEADARAAALKRPGERAANSVRGDLLANAQDVSFNLPSTIPQMTINGGMRPSMFSANTRALGQDMSAQALAGQRANDDLLPLPTTVATPQAGRLDNILNTAATVGTIGSAIPYRRTPRPGDPDYVAPGR
jgi:hypothetical protein